MQKVMGNKAVPPGGIPGLPPLFAVVTIEQAVAGDTRALLADTLAAATDGLTAVNAKSYFQDVGYGGFTVTPSFYLGPANGTPPPQVRFECTDLAISLRTGLPESGTVTGIVFETAEPALIVRISGLKLPVADVKTQMLFDPHGYDYLDAKLENSVFHYGGSDGADTLTATSHADDLEGRGGDDRLHGGAGADDISGNGGSDRLWGDDGRDQLGGGSGDDRLYGGAGADTLVGGSGDDLIKGGSDDDDITGGSGRDQLYGNDGDDTFRFAAGDSGISKSSRDVVAGFEHGHDTIDLSALDGAFDWIGGGAFDGSGHQVRASQHDAAGTADDYTMVSVDIDGRNGADLQIKLTGLVTLGEGDFLL